MTRKYIVLDNVKSFRLFLFDNRSIVFLRSATCWLIYFLHSEHCLGFLTSGMTDCSSCVFYLLIHATCFCIWQSFTSHGADDSLSASQPCELKPWGQMRLYLCWMITHGLPKDIHTVTNMQINWCYSHTNTEINKLKSWFLSINDCSFYLY